MSTSGAWRWVERPRLGERSAAGVLVKALVFLGLLVLASCRPGASSTAGPVTTPEPDSDAAKCESFLSALKASDWDAAERDFGTTMRTKVPPHALAETWRRLVTRYGALSSWRVAQRDHPRGKDRFTLELTLAAGVARGLVVFDPATAQIIGVWFTPGGVYQPSTQAPDPRVREVDESVGLPPFTLPASLTLPAGASGGPFPAVVLIAGSGPNDRDETIEHLRPFRDLAFTLARHDVAALRYDKRTFAHRDLFDPEKGTVEEEVIADAVAAVGRLRSRREIDPNRIFIVGHSLGGLLAPEVAARAGGVVGLVLIAAPGRPPLEVSLDQRRRRGAAPEVLASLEAQVRALATLPAHEQILGVPASYWRDLTQRDEMAVAKRLGLPILLLRGAMDQNVLGVDQERWVQALTGAVPIENVTLPGLTHFLVPAGTLPSANVQVPDEVGERIATFIVATTKAPTPVRSTDGGTAP